MPNTKISADPAVTTPLSGAEIFPVLQSGVNKIVTLTQLTAKILGADSIATAMIQANAVGNARMADMPAHTVKLNPSATTAGDPVDFSLAANTLIVADDAAAIKAMALGDKVSIAGDVFNIIDPTEAEVLSAGNFLRYDADNDPINAAGAKLNTVPSYTWALKPAASTNTDKWIYITDVGMEKALWKSNGTRWIPQGRVLELFRGNWGSVASPTLTRTTVGKYNIGTDPVLPAGFLQLGDELEVYGLIRKTGTVGTNTFRLHLGTSATPTSNSLLYGVTPTTLTDGQEVFINPVAVVAIVGTGIDTYVTSSRIAKGGTGLANAMEDQGVLFDTATAMTLTANLTSSGGSGDAISLLYLRVVYRC